MEISNGPPPSRTGHAALPHPLGFAIMGGLSKESEPLGDLQVLRILTLANKKTEEVDERQDSSDRGGGRMSLWSLQIRSR